MNRRFWLAFLIIIFFQILWTFPVESSANGFPRIVSVGRYVVYESRFWISYNKTIQQLRDEGYALPGDPDWLMQVNYTRLNYTLKCTIVELSWPQVTLENIEGAHNLNITIRRIMEDGSLGDEVESYLWVNQPPRVANVWKCKDPFFGLGYNPSELFLGNSILLDSDTQLPISVNVNGTEILTDTILGTSDTYIINMNLSNSTMSSISVVWCHSETGLILRQIVDSVTPQYVAHEKLVAIETGIAFWAPYSPALETALLPITVGTCLTIGFSAVMYYPSLVDLLSRTTHLRIPQPLRDFLKFFVEEKLEAIRRERLEPLTRFPFFTRKEIRNGVICASIATMAFTYAHESVSGPLDLLSPSVLLNIMPATLLSAGILVIAEEFFGAVASKIHGVRAEYRIWLQGTITFLVSTSLRFPFGSPGRSAYQSDETDSGANALAGISKILMLLALLTPYSILLMLGFLAVGSIGVCFSMMTACYLLIPISPFEGVELRKSHAKTWGALIAFTSAIYLLWLSHRLSPMACLLIGLVSLFLSMISLRRARLK